MDEAQGYEPLPRWGHTSVTIGDKVYMWGGRTEDFSESSRMEVHVGVAVGVAMDVCGCGYVWVWLCMW